MKDKLEFDEENVYEVQRNAYNNIHGKFINVNTVSERENNIIEENDVRVNMLSEVEKIKKSSHFSRFDHSVVVIEYKEKYFKRPDYTQEQGIHQNYFL